MQRTISEYEDKVTLSSFIFTCTYLKASEDCLDMTNQTESELVCAARLLLITN